jgi:C-terminal processing protease CtpA/Prc
MIKRAALMGHVKLVVRRLKDTWTNGYNTSTFTDYAHDARAQSSQTYDVHLVKSPNEDFGCTLVTIEHRFIGRIIPGTPAERCGRLRAGDCIAMINGFSTAHMTHRQVIDYIKSCGNQVTFTIDPAIQIPRYAAPAQNGTTIGKPIESEDAIYTTTNEYGSLARNGTQYHSNGNIVMGTGLDYLNEDDKDFNLLAVELSRGPKNFGFSIRGGFEFGRMPLFILRIADDGPAAEEGSLRVGDQLVEINGEDTSGMTHERAISLIREQNTVRLVVKRKLA